MDADLVLDSRYGFILKSVQINQKYEDDLCMANQL
jgi:hypothetical protein